MFVHKKKNRSGSTSVVVVDKRGHQFREIKTIGVSSDAKEISAVYQAGKEWISSHCSGCDMFEDHTKEQEKKQITEYLLSNVENILLNGVQLIIHRKLKIGGRGR